MLNKWKHLSYEERCVIERLRNGGYSIRSIAKILNRSANTISYELFINKVNGVYIASKAQVKYYQRRYRCKRDCMKVAINTFLHRHVDDRIRLKWSPERISGDLRRNYRVVCSTKAIYKYIKARCLERYLMHKGKKINKSYYKHNSFLQGDRKYIDVRPVLTKESGHYELDFIVSSLSAYVLLVCVDIYTKYTKILLLPNRKHVTMLRAFYELFEGKSILSITTDNDIAFSKWKQLEHLFNTKIFFTHPYHSWEKGLVENTNRWIRNYIPKKTELSTVTSKQISDSLYYLNDIPRQILDYKKPSELYLVY